MNNNEEIIEILDDINDSENVLPNLGPTPINTSPSIPTNELTEEYMELEKQLEEVNYEPINTVSEEIKIQTEEEADQGKSGLGFVIVLFVILAAFIIALPYITKLI